MKTDLKAYAPVLSVKDAETIRHASQRGIILHSVRVVNGSAVSGHAVYVQSTGPAPNHTGPFRVVRGRVADDWFAQLQPVIASEQSHREFFSLINGIPAYVGFSRQGLGSEYILVVGERMQLIDTFSIGHLIHGKLHLAFKARSGPWQIMHDKDMLHESRNPILDFGYDEDENLILLEAENGTERLVAWGQQLDKIQRLQFNYDEKGRVIRIYGEREGQGLSWTKGEEPKWSSLASIHAPIQNQILGCAQ